MSETAGEVTAKVKKSDYGREANMMKKKMIAVIAAGMIAAMAVTGCGATGTSQNSGTQAVQGTGSAALKANAAETGSRPISTNDRPCRPVSSNADIQVIVPRHVEVVAKMSRKS